MTLGGIALATDFAIVVVTATVLSFVARQTNQPTIVAYLAAGLLLGPVVFDVVTEDQLIEVMSELGLGFLLFLLGIEMSFGRIRDILRSIVTISVGQTILQTAAAFGVAFLVGFRGMDVVVIALATVFGATPVIVKLLDDKDELDTLSGRIDVGVLIVQDIYLVIVLAIVGAGLEGPAGELAVRIGRILALIAGIGVVAFLAYRYVLPRLLHAVASDRDVLFVTGLAWAFVFILGAETLGLTIEVGAFIAGLSLAQLPYSTELKERMGPITDFFLVVFFTSIGLRLSADDLIAFWQEAFLAAGVLMLANFLIMFYLIDREGFDLETTFIGSINMIQVSEFSLVVGTLAVSQELVAEGILGYLSLMALTTMTLSTYVILYNRRIYEAVQPYLERFIAEEGREAGLDVVEDHALVVGYDPVVRRVLPVLREHFADVVVVDRSAENVSELEELAASGGNPEAERDEDREGDPETVDYGDVHYHYGDIRHGDVRQEADVGTAAFVLSTARPTSVSAQLVDEAPDDALVLAAAQHVDEANALYDRDVDYVVMKEILAGEMLGAYIEEYLANPELFLESIEAEIEDVFGGEIG